MSPARKRASLQGVRVSSLPWCIATDGGGGDDGGGGGAAAWGRVCVAGWGGGGAGGGGDGKCRRNSLQTCLARDASTVA